MMKKVAGLKLAAWIAVTAFTVFFSTAVVCTAADGILQVTVEKEAQNPIQGITVYLFNENGTYLNQNQVTNSAGSVEFNLSEGTYKIRADYLGYQFWSQVYSIDGDISGTLTIAHQDVTITVQGEYQGMQPLAGLPVYLFTEAGSYQNQNKTTDGNGQVVFNLPEQSYKVRADYLGQQFWSDPFTWQNTPVTVPMSDAEITVTGAGLSLEGVNVYVFSSSGSYLSMSDTTGSDGKVIFRLPAGAYKFRADYQSSQYWTDEETLTAGQVNPISISTGGGALTFTVLKGPGNPLNGVNCYVFNEAGTYLGMSANTDSNGQVNFSLSDGSYKIRVDYLGYQFWSQVYSIDGDISGTLTIAHQDITITVQGEYQGMQPLSGLPVYLFTESGAYQSQARTTNANGQVFFNLPERAYKVRTDYLGQQFWSDPFTWQDTPVTIPMADAEITLTGAGLPLEGVNVYVFSSSGSYLSLTNTTGSDGKVTFRLPAGAYKFRADYQSSQYWTDEETLTAGQVNSIGISTGGGTLTFTVLKGLGNPLTGVNCYVFNEAGTYLGMSSNTDSNGQVAFNLSDGSYKIRIDYLGYQFWSQVYSINGDISGTLTIAHQDITITVQGEYQGMQPLAGLPVYLFTEAGSYQSQSQTTDGNGQVVFNLPEQVYKIRADYLGQQFWSDPFTWQNTSVTIQEGMAEIHITRSGADVSGARVYLFNQSGSYLGRHETTDATGNVQFRLPSRTYKFRANEGGDQAWSSEIQITAGIVNDVSIDFSPVSVIISAYPETIHVGQTSTLTWSSTNAGSATIDQGIGSVAVSGSTVVSPTETTTYTIAVTGTQGSAVASTTVTVTNNPPVAVNDFVSTDEDTPITAIAVLVNDSDPDGDTLSISDFTQPLHGTAGSNGDGTLTYTPSLNYNGTGSFTYTVSDGNGGTATATVNIIINPVNDAPVANDQTVTLNEDETSSITLTASDADGDALTYQIVSIPTHGTLTGVAPDLTYTPAESYNGSDAFTFRVNDGTIDSGDATISITVNSVNDTPTAVDDVVTTNEDTPITAIAVLVNDSDPDDDTVSISDFTQPSHGTSGSNGDGTLTYTPDADFNGSDSFTYTITDGTLESAPASVTVTINPVNDPPVANAGTDQSVNGGDTVNLDGSLSSDVDGNTLIYQWSFVTRPAGSSAVLSDPTATTPTFAADVDGTYELQLLVNDGTVDSPPDAVTITATVTVVYPPTISIIEPDGVGDVADTGFSVRWNDADPDNNASISLYYDTNSSGADGTLIVSGLSEDPDSASDDSYVWNTGGLPDSSYYIYAVIDDGVHDPVVSYSSGAVTIDHTYPAVAEDKQTTGDLSGSEHAVAIDGDSAIVAKIGAVSFYQHSGSEWIEQAEFTSAELGIDTISIQADIDGEMFACDEPAVCSGQVIELNTNPIANFFNLRILPNIGDGDILITSIELFMNDTWVLKNSDIDWTGYDIYYQPGEGWIIPADSYSGADLVSRFGWSPENMATKMRIAFEKKGTSISDMDTSVAISGDFAVMGVPYYGTGNLPYSPGSVYVFKREGTTWVFHSKLTPTDKPEWGGFGYSVAIDGNTVAAGGPDIGDSYTGAVYIFRFNGAYWAQEAKLVPSDAAPWSIFGSSVAVNSDSVIVGASQAMYDGIQSGAAYVFTFDGDNWTEQAKLGSNSPSDYDFFGKSVDIDGDTALIGAPYATNGGAQTGLTYVFNRNGSIWSQQALLTSGDAAEGDAFGQSVSVSGDHAVIGAPKVFNGGFQWGAAYLFKRNGTYWEELAKLVPTDTAEYVSFAHAVSIDGDTAMVGKLQDNELGIDGTVYFYTIPAVSVTLTAEPEAAPDGQFTLTWESENADTCEIEPEVGTIAVNGSNSVSVTDTTTFTITATGIYGTATADVTVRVDVPLPTVNISTDTSTIVAGEPVNLTWTSTDAASVSLEPGIGNVVLNGGTTVSPVETTTYTITASGPGGLAADTVTISVIPKPSVGLMLYPYSIYIGESTMLSWDTEYADSATIDQGIGSVNLSGSMTIYPTETGYYTLTAIGPGGISSVSAYVYVQCPPPGVTLTAEPDTITEGESSTLTWVTTYADLVTIEPDIGSVGLSGSITVSPTSTTEYTLSATGPCGISSVSTYVYVQCPLPGATLTVEPDTITEGESSTLTWDTTYAVSVTIEPDVGSVGLSGSVTVSPTETTEYTLSVTGPCGSTQRSVTVTVQKPPGIYYEYDALGRIKKIIRIPK